MVTVTGHYYETIDTQQAYTYSAFDLSQTAKLSQALISAATKEKQNYLDIQKSLDAEIEESINLVDKETEDKLRKSRLYWEKDILEIDARLKLFQDKINICNTVYK